MATFFSVNHAFTHQVCHLVLSEDWNESSAIDFNIFNIKGNIKKVEKTENPTKYRCPTTYVDFFHSKTITENGSLYGFELVFARPNRTYIEVNITIRVS